MTQITFEFWFGQRSAAMHLKVISKSAGFGVRACRVYSSASKSKMRNYLREFSLELVVYGELNHTIYNVLHSS